MPAEHAVFAVGGPIVAQSAIIRMLLYQTNMETVHQDQAVHLMFRTAVNVIRKIQTGASVVNICMDFVAVFVPDAHLIYTKDQRSHAMQIALQFSIVTLAQIMTMMTVNVKMAMFIA